MRTLADKDSYTSNTQIRAKLAATTNPVTKSVYKSIIVHRAQRAITLQPYYGGKI